MRSELFRLSYSHWPAANRFGLLQDDDSDPAVRFPVILISQQTDTPKSHDKVCSG
jgi:hypothetical protein